MPLSRRDVLTLPALGLMLGALPATWASSRTGAVPLRFAWPMNVGPLNPHLYSPNQMFAQGMVYEPLVRYRADGQVVPWLAKSWTLSDDGRNYVFTLREDVMFSNGERFDAAAAKANFDAVLANRERHSWLELVNQIATTQVLAPFILKVSLRESYYPALQELALPRPFRFVAPSQFIDGGTKAGIHAPIGTGPWMLSDTSMGEHDVFIRNERYWGDKPVYPGIVVKVMPDPNTRAIALRTGEVDMVYGTSGALSPDTYEALSRSGAFRCGLSAPMEASVLALNTASGATQDLAVRKAINHAVDKDALISSVLRDTEQRADTLFAANVPYANLGLVAYRFDPDHARELLESAGWIADSAQGRRRKGDRELVLDLCFIGTDAIAKAKAEVLQADLAAVGIGINLVGEEESSVLARQRDGRFHLIFNSTWGAPYDPHAFLSSMRVPAHADYQAQRGLEDKAEIDRRIGEVLVTTDPVLRQAHYRELLTRLHEAAVYLPLTYVTAVMVARPEVGPLRFGAMASEIPFEQLAPDV